MLPMTWQRPLLVAKLSPERAMAPSHQYTLQVAYTPTPFRLLSFRLFILPPIIPGERLSASAELAGENG